MKPHGEFRVYINNEPCVLMREAEQREKKPCINVIVMNKIERVFLNGTSQQVIVDLAAQSRL